MIYVDFSAEELRGKTIKIENTGLQPIYMTLITDIATGAALGNVKRVQIDLNVDGMASHAIATLTLDDDTQVTLENPELKLDAIARIEES